MIWMNTYPVWVGDFANTVPEKILREQNRKITEAGGAPGSSLLAAGQGEQAPRSTLTGVLRSGPGYGAAGKTVLCCGKWVVQGVSFGTASAGVGKAQPTERLGWNFIEICGCNRYPLRINDLSLCFIVGLAL